MNDMPFFARDTKKKQKSSEEANMSFELYKLNNNVYKAIKSSLANIEDIRRLVGGSYCALGFENDIRFYNSIKDMHNRLNIGDWLCINIYNDNDFFSVSNEEFIKKYVKINSNAEVGIIKSKNEEFVFAEPKEINTAAPAPEVIMQIKIEELSKQISDLEDKKFRLKEEVEYIQREKAEISAYEKREYIIRKKTIEEEYKEFIKTPCKELGEQDTLDQAIALVICEAFTNGYLRGSKYLCDLTGTKLIYKQ